MAVINPFTEATETIIETRGEALKSGYQCGLCTAICPWNLVRSFVEIRDISKLVNEAT